MRGGGKRVQAGGSPCTPAKMAATDAIRRSLTTPSYHARPKLPAGDSPYVRAKHAQLVEKDPNKAVPLFWAAINSGDRIDSALKDMSLVMKQMNRAEEAIEAIKSFRCLCPAEHQDSLDNILLDLYKKCGRIEDQIELLNFKLTMIDKGVAFGGRTTKPGKSQGRRFHVTLAHEKARLLGNLAWAYMQCENYKEAELLYREALVIEQDYNKQCNLAICLMQTGRVLEGKALLQGVKETLTSCNTESFIKSFQRASDMLMALDSRWSPQLNKEESRVEAQNILPSASDKYLRSQTSTTNGFYSVNEISSPIYDGRWNRESVGKRVPSPISCYPKSSRYFTANENTLLDWFSKKEASANIYNKRWNITYQEALFSPVHRSGNQRLVYRGPWTDPRSSADKNQTFETPIKCQAMGYKKPRMDHFTKVYQAEDENPKHPGLPYRSQAKASKRLIFERWNKEHSPISDNMPACDIRILKPLAEDSSVINGQRWIRADQEMEKSATKFNSDNQMHKPMTESCAINNENMLDKTTDKQNGRNMKDLVNEDLCRRSRTSAEDSRRFVNKAISSSVSVSVNECLKPDPDSSAVISMRTSSEDHAVEKSKAENCVAKPNIPKQSPAISLQEAPTELNVNRNKINNFREKVTFGRWRSVQYLIDGLISTSKNEKRNQKGDSPSCTKMVKEDSHEARVSWNSDAATIHIIRSSKDLCEENFSTPSVLKSGGSTWAGMVDEECKAEENSKDCKATTYTTGSLKNSSVECFQTQPVVKTGRRTWADMVEEEEPVPNENIDNAGTTIDHAEPKCSVPSSGWDDCEGFQDENVTLNILGSALQRHQGSHKFAESVHQRLEMVDLPEDSKYAGKASGIITSACRSLVFSQQAKLDETRV